MPTAVPDQAQVQEPEEQLDVGCRAASLLPSPPGHPAPTALAPAPSTTEASGLQDDGPGVAGSAPHDKRTPASLAMQASQPEQARPASFPPQQLPVDGGLLSGSTHGLALTKCANIPALPAAQAPAVLPVPGVAGDVGPPLLPPVAGTLPPPAAECQLPGDLVEGYGIKESKVLTSDEAPGS
jgi:hypothetical protein